jgi:hypothetical protein
VKVCRNIGDSVLNGEKEENGAKYVPLNISER